MQILFLAYLIRGLKEEMGWRELLRSFKNLLYIWCYPKVTSVQNTPNTSHFMPLRRRNRKS
jgi:hypothetical protein